MWIKAAKVQDLVEGQGQLVSANGKDAALFKVGKDFFAIDNACPHRRGPLVEGAVENGMVTCPLHAWQFNLKTGECPMIPDMQQTVYPVRIEGEEIWIDL
jgi:nitrite reductase (NADH) small subunit